MDLRARSGWPRPDAGQGQFGSVPERSRWGLPHHRRLPARVQLVTVVFSRLRLESVMRRVIGAWVGIT